MAIKDPELNRHRAVADNKVQECREAFLARVKEIYPMGTSLQVPKLKGMVVVVVLDHKSNSANGSSVGASLLVCNKTTGKEYWVSVDSLGGK